MQLASIHRAAVPKHRPRALTASTSISWVPGLHQAHDEPRLGAYKDASSARVKIPVWKELVMKTNPEINSRTSQVFSELREGNNYFCWEDQGRLLRNL